MFYLSHTRERLRRRRRCLRLIRVCQRFSSFWNSLLASFPESCCCHHGYSLQKHCCKRFIVNGSKTDQIHINNNLTRSLITSIKRWQFQINCFSRNFDQKFLPFFSSSAKNWKKLRRQNPSRRMSKQMEKRVTQNTIIRDGKCAKTKPCAAKKQIAGRFDEYSTTRTKLCSACKKHWH